MGEESYSVNAIGSISPSLSNTNLVYSGFKDTTVGLYMSKSLYELNNIGQSVISKKIEGYWAYDGDYKTRFYINPDKGQLLVNKNNNCMVIKYSGIKLTHSGKISDNAADWARQFSERSDELIEAYPGAFLNLKIFYDLCQVLKWVHTDHSLSDIFTSFSEFTPDIVYTPKMFDFDFMLVKMN